LQASVSCHEHQTGLCIMNDLKRRNCFALLLIGLLG
jgi:hypothetical protein